MNKKEELQMWWILFQELRKVPIDYRSQNHTAFKAEVQMNVYELSWETGVQQKDFSLTPPYTIVFPEEQ